MNKPAAKEPTMDEILSSIRQIIADDDAAPLPGPTAGEEPAAAEEPEADTPSFGALIDEETEDDGEDEPLELSEAQIIESPEEDATDGGGDEAALIVPDDIAFDQEPGEPGSMSVSDVAPMPDAGLAAELTEQLMDATTQAAASHAFSRLGKDMPLGAGAVTIEQMIREMLRPMLKDWLDENLPSVVERLVEKEIERVSRGGK